MSDLMKLPVRTEPGQPGLHHWSITHICSTVWTWVDPLVRGPGEQAYGKDFFAWTESDSGASGTHSVTESVSIPLPGHAWQSKIKSLGLPIAAGIAGEANRPSAKIKTGDDAANRLSGGSGNDRLSGS